MCVGNEKKKHLQFNDITAPSLARRAARRGAEKGESGRMEPGVINVFFLSSCKKQHWILLILFKPLPFSITSCYFFLFAYSFLIFVAMKLSLMLFRKLTISTIQSSSLFLILSDFLNKKFPSTLATGAPPHPPGPLILLCLASSKCNRCLAQ